MSKHEIRKDAAPFKSDLKRNPGIGQTKGSLASGEDPEEIEGDNTAEGDIENDVEPSGAVDPRQLGRTNK